MGKQTPDLNLTSSVASAAAGATTAPDKDAAQPAGSPNTDEIRRILEDARAEAATILTEARKAAEGVVAEARNAASVVVGEARKAAAGLVTEANNAAAAVQQEIRQMREQAATALSAPPVVQPPASLPADSSLRPTHAVKYRVEGAEWELHLAGDKLLCPKSGNVLVEGAKPAPAEAFPDGTYKVITRLPA